MGWVKLRKLLFQSSSVFGWKGRDFRQRGDALGSEVSLGGKFPNGFFPEEEFFPVEINRGGIFRGGGLGFRLGGYSIYFQMFCN